MAQIQPPETFDFSTPNEWPKWRKKFERYLVVSGMKKKEEADKIDLFMYLMGDRADDIFRTFKFEKEEEATKIDSVLKAFDSHFCVRKNIIYEHKQAKTAEVKAVSELDEEIGFLLEVSAVEDSSNLDDDEDECRRRWTAEIQVNGTRVKFKLDSQADVTCVPLCLFKKIMGQQRLVKSDINIRAAEFSELQTVAMCCLKRSDCCLPPTPVYFLKDYRRFYQLLSPVLLLFSFTVLQLVQQRDIPGIDAAYLAMDTEEGVEVVWNEVNFSEKKHFKAQEAKMRQVFDTLTQLDHPNIVKFHKYWIDRDAERVVFITEYMSSGSLKAFLKKTKHNVIRLPLQAWKRWSTQILSALSYLHSCSPPIIHANLTCDTIFIQHNGLIKIGSVAPDAIHRHVKTFGNKLQNMHFIAPEVGRKSYGVPTPAVDIYAFGIIALEMAALELTSNGGETGSTAVTPDVINKTIESVENELQREFIRLCLKRNPMERPSARNLMFHPIIFEVHSLKLQAAHVLLNNAYYQADKLTDEAFRSRFGTEFAAEIHHTDGRPPLIQRLQESQTLELEKFLEDVRNGIYPLIAFAPTRTPVVRALSPEMAEMCQDCVETRRVINMMCNIKPQDDTLIVTFLPSLLTSILTYNMYHK
ncbi:NRBP1 [Cordylochernes scorpioides]|uniref:NRBP1 n=1 Tax=Cordylochernes scorpioides TaxID=51811 RepID=A0ABY6LPF7_9ARAC|nr:NRBP1 [Cordylochernes scorpioides]